MGESRTEQGRVRLWCSLLAHRGHQSRGGLGGGDRAGWKGLVPGTTASLRHGLGAAPWQLGLSLNTEDILRELTAGGYLPATLLEAPWQGISCKGGPDWHTSCLPQLLPNGTPPGAITLDSYRLYFKIMSSFSLTTNLCPMILSTAPPSPCDLYPSVPPWLDSRLLLISPASLAGFTSLDSRVWHFNVALCCSSCSSDFLSCLADWLLILDRPTVCFPPKLEWWASLEKHGSPGNGELHSMTARFIKPFPVEILPSSSYRLLIPLTLHLTSGDNGHLPDSDSCWRHPHAWIIRVRPSPSSFYVGTLRWQLLLLWLCSNAQNSATDFLALKIFLNE